MNFKDCSEINTNKIVTVTENKRKFTINNRHQRTIAKIQVECYIVCSRVPKAGAKVQELQEKMKKQCQAKLSVKTNQHEIDI